MTNKEKVIQELEENVTMLSGNGVPAEEIHQIVDHAIELGPEGIIQRLIEEARGAADLMDEGVGKIFAHALVDSLEKALAGKKVGKFAPGWLEEEVDEDDEESPLKSMYKSRLSEEGDDGK